MVLGCDMMSSLGIGITGLISSWFDYAGPKLPAPIDPDYIQPNNTPVGSEDERNQMMSKNSTTIRCKL